MCKVGGRGLVFVRLVLGVCDGLKSCWMLDDVDVEGGSLRFGVDGYRFVS